MATASGPRAPASASRSAIRWSAITVLRALLVDLDKWVTEGKEPPPSQLPRRGDGTLVSLDAGDVGFPAIPGVKYNGRMHTGDLFDFGPQSDDGILTMLPPKLVGSPYPAFVPRDRRRRQRHGRHPAARHRGSGRDLYRLEPAQESGGGRLRSFGQVIPFAKTKAERVAKGDPRLSIEERYADHAAYVGAVRKAAADSVKQGFLLKEDADRYVAAAEASDVRK